MRSFEGLPAPQASVFIVSYTGYVFGVFIKTLLALSAPSSTRGTFESQCVSRRTPTRSRSGASWTPGHSIAVGIADRVGGFCDPRPTARRRGLTGLRLDRDASARALPVDSASHEPAIVEKSRFHRTFTATNRPESVGG